MPLIPVANTLQAKLAAALGTAKASLLVCAVIRSLVERLSEYLLSPFFAIRMDSDFNLAEPYLAGLSNKDTVAGRCR